MTCLLREQPPAQTRSSRKSKRQQCDDAETEERKGKRRRTAAELADSLDNLVKNRAEERSAYIELPWLPVASMQVERLFSSLKCMLGYLRKSMSAETLETIVYLRMNWNLVSDEVVSKVVKRV